MEHKDTSSIVQAHQPCADCGSSDALSVYSDNHTYCFACQKHTQGDGPTTQAPRQQAPTVASGLRTGEIRELKARNISLDTCKAFGYATQPGVQIAPYVDASGQVVAQKLRGKDKSFGWAGYPANVELFGRQLWNGCDPKVLVVTEGEIDAMSVYEVTRGQMPVVSLQNGAQSAVKSFKQSFEWLNSFESVVLCFDNDEPGRAAAKEAAQVLAPGKVKIAELPLKDANDMLKDGRSAELYTALKHAKVHRPDGIKMGDELINEALRDDPEHDALYPWAGLNELSYGMHYGELVTITAGIGTGKTSLLTELMYSLQQGGHKVGMMMLEEPTKKTSRRLIGHHLNLPIQVSREGATQDQLKAAAQAVLGGTNGVVLYDHRGVMNMESIFAKVTFMVKVLGVKFVVLDNLSAIVAGMDDKDERKAIDKAMRGLWELAQSEQIVIFLAVHLKRIEGNKGHEDGVQTSLSHLRGSQSIASNSDLVLGLERDQQGDNANRSTLRVLKNRLTGETGIAGYLDYDRPTGRLREASDVSPFQPTSKAPTHNTDF